MAPLVQNGDSCVFHRRGPRPTANILWSKFLTSDRLRASENGQIYQFQTNCSFKKDGRCLHELPEVRRSGSEQERFLLAGRPRGHAPAGLRHAGFVHVRRFCSDAFDAGRWESHRPFGGSRSGTNGLEGVKPIRLVYSAIMIPLLELHGCTVSAGQSGLPSRLVSFQELNHSAIFFCFFSLLLHS